MSVETSEEYIITRRPKTRYYHEKIQKCLPPEIKWLEHFVSKEFPQTICSKNRGLYQLHPMYFSKVSSSTLVLGYAVFIWDQKMSEPTEAQFGSNIKDMVEMKLCLLGKKGANITRQLDVLEMRCIWLFERKGVHGISIYLLGNDDDEYYGMTPPARIEYEE